MKACADKSPDEMIMDKIFVVKGRANAHVCRIECIKGQEVSVIKVINKSQKGNDQKV